MDKNLSIDELMPRVRQGDPEALAIVIERVLGCVQQLVPQKLGPKLRSRVEAEDVVQSVMIEVVRDLRKAEYRGDDALLGWIGRIVQHKLCDKAEHFTRQKRDVGRERPLTVSDSTVSHFGDGQNLATSSRSPASKVATREETQRLRRAVEDLPDELKQVLIETQFHHRPLREVGLSLGISENAVARRLVKAIHALRLKLGSDSSWCPA
jgi:RNA polymerase sigma-70 factor (subfamily 1)